MAQTKRPTSINSKLLPPCSCASILLTSPRPQLLRLLLSTAPPPVSPLRFPTRRRRRLSDSPARAVSSVKPAPLRPTAPGRALGPAARCSSLRSSGPARADVCRLARPPAADRLGLGSTPPAAGGVLPLLRVPPGDQRPGSAPSSPLSSGRRLHLLQYPKQSVSFHGTLSQMPLKSEHMTGNLDLLMNYTPTRPGRPVRTLTLLQVCGRGSVRSKHLAIVGISHVPGLTENIISLSQLTDRGFNLTFGPDGCTVSRNRDGAEVGNASYAGGQLYQSTRSTSSGLLPVTQSQSQQVAC